MAPTYHADVRWGMIMQSDEPTTEQEDTSLLSPDELVRRGLINLPKGVDLVKTDQGFRMVQNRRSGNKWLGSENPRSKINPNGFDPVERAAKQAKDAVTRKLELAVKRHG